MPTKPICRSEVVKLIVHYGPQQLRTNDDIDKLEAVLMMVQAIGGMMTGQQEKEHNSAQRQANS